MTDNKSNTRYNQLLVTARKLFWKHGLKRVTVEEICREAGVSKMTFYKYFPNKFELARTVYDNAVDEGYSQFRSIMSDKSSSPLQKMELLLFMKMEGSNDISREFLSDFYSNHELGLADHVEKRTRETWSLIIKDFRKAQEEGWLRHDFKPEGIFLFMTRLFDVYQDENALELYGSPQELIMELARFFTFGIMPRESDGKGKR